MNNSFTSHERPYSQARQRSRNYSATKSTANNEGLSLGALYNSAMANNTKTDDLSNRLDSSITKEASNNTHYAPQRYLHIKNDKPFTTLQKCYPVIKKETKAYSKALYNSSEVTDPSLCTAESTLSFLKGKTGYKGDAKQGTAIPAMATLLEQKQQIMRLGSNDSRTRKNSTGRKYQTIDREYYSAGTAGLRGSHNGLNASVNMSFEKEKYSQSFIQDKDRGSAVLRDSVIGMKGIDPKVLEDYQKRHKAFVDSMKILQEMASQVDISNEHVINCIKKLNDTTGNEDNTWNESYKELLFSELGEMLEQKIQYRPLNEKMKKEQIEDFGTKVAMYLKRIGEGLTKQGNPETALMLMTLNKILALELEDIFASYVFQIKILKQNPEKELIMELAKERAKNKQLNVMMNLRKIGFHDASMELHRQIERYKSDRNEFEDQIKRQEGLIQSLLKQVKRGLTKPLELERTRSKRKKKPVNGEKRRHSLDLDAIAAVQDVRPDFLPERRKKK